MYLYKMDLTESYNVTTSITFSRLNHKKLTIFTIIKHSAEKCCDLLCEVVDNSVVGFDKCVIQNL